MNRGPLLFLATFFLMGASLLTFVVLPQAQIGSQQQVEEKQNGQLYPLMRAGMARQGEQVYRANGCFYCHTEQVRPKGFGADVARGWGARPGDVQNVAQDYLYDHPAMPGRLRIGPDLANIGARQTNETTLMLHLYNPQITAPKSVMPPYHYLFEVRKLRPGGKPSVDALAVGDSVPRDCEVVPKDEAKALVAYLLGLRSEGILLEAPSLQTNKPAATNVPPGAATNASPTNSPSK